MIRLSPDKTVIEDNDPSRRSINFKRPSELTKFKEEAKQSESTSKEAVTGSQQPVESAVSFAKLGEDQTPEFRYSQIAEDG